MSQAYSSSLPLISPLFQWYSRAQPDYDELYVRMYIAYNAWYREATGTLNDRQALTLLKKRWVIWDEYRSNITLPSLRPCMERIVELSQREPFTPSAYWSGVVESPYDWRSLIEYWYQVRCLVVHGMPVKPSHVQLAYESLMIYMTEIINRMKKCLHSADMWQVDMHRSI